MPIPVILSPTGVQAVHPDGEVAVARGAAARGVTMGLSCFGSKPVEEVVAANPRLLFQTYWCGSRDQIAARIDRARTAGVMGLIITETRSTTPSQVTLGRGSFSNGRDWGSPFIPEKVNREAVVRYAPEVLCRPGWLLDWVKTGRLPDLTVPNMATPGEAAPSFFGAYREHLQTPPPTWDDLHWLREQWDGPCMFKGIMRVDDAKRAVDVGFTAISVSNHGGNNMDGTPATIRALPAIAEAVGSQIEVLMDGGVRRGGDVVKALALGAKAVLVGRPYLWALAANAQAGVENLLDILSGGIESTMFGLGRSSLAEISRDDLVIPDGFFRPLGV
jgi:heme/flavin dehydrogenase (mycofactocin system)